MPTPRRFLAILVTVTLAAAAHAQQQHQETDEANPKPFDPRFEIREYFRQAMPTYWWYEEPDFHAGVFTVVVHVPDNWRGNPTSAMARFCPDRDHRLWTGIERLMIVPFYRKRPWSGTECRS